MKKPEFLPWTDAEWQKWIDESGTGLRIGEFTVYHNDNRYVVVQHPRWELGSIIERATYLYKDRDSNVRNWLWMLWFTPDLIHELHFKRPGQCIIMYPPLPGAGRAGIYPL